MMKFAMEPEPFSTPLQRQTPKESFVKSVVIPGSIVLAIILLGAGSGWYLSQGGAGIPGVGQQANKAAPGADVSLSGKEVGLDDAKTFRDNATGTLEDGGLEEDGTHHLVRDGGPSQTVYMTSSVVDLDQFIGKKVEVWGETIDGKKAGWLMDVGKIKVIE